MEAPDPIQCGGYGFRLKAQAMKDEYHRGEMRVLDRLGLEGAACSCYATNQQSYRQVMG